MAHSSKASHRGNWKLLILTAGKRALGAVVYQLPGNQRRFPVFQSWFPFFPFTTKSFPSQSTFNFSEVFWRSHFQSVWSKRSLRLFAAGLDHRVTCQDNPFGSNHASGWSGGLPDLLFLGGRCSCASHSCWSLLRLIPGFLPTLRSSKLGSFFMNGSCCFYLLISRWIQWYHIISSNTIPLHIPPSNTPLIYRTCYHQRAQKQWICEHLMNIKP